MSGGSLIVQAGVWPLLEQSDQYGHWTKDRAGCWLKEGELKELLETKMHFLKPSLAPSSQMPA